MISNCGYQWYRGFPTTPQPHCRIYGLGTGTVCHGTGTVQENPTRGLPVLNPIRDAADYSGKIPSSQRNLQEEFLKFSEASVKS